MFLHLMRQIGEHMHELCKSLATDSLTKTERILRDFFLDKGMECCFMTSTDIAIAAGVSEASVIRFARKLGYSGFSSFQKQMQGRYKKLHAQQIPETITVPYERLLKSLEHDDDNYVEKYALSAQNDIYSAITNNSKELYDAAAKSIINSANKFVYGERTTYGLAAYTYFLMNSMLGNVFFANNPAANPIDNIGGITDKDCLILFSFPRYSQGCGLLAEMAHKAGAAIISITDKHSAPVAQFATHALTVDVSSPYFFNSFTGAQHVLETLCAGISTFTKGAYGNKLKRIDTYLDVLQLY